MINLAILLEESAREVPERTAIIFDEIRLSYAAVNAAANQVANVLAQAGIHKGETVALSCPNVPYFPIVYYGILKAGAVVMPLNVLLKPREIAYHLRDADAKAYFCFEGTSELAIGEMGFTAFQEVDSCQHFFLMTGNPTAPSPIAGAQTLGMQMQNQPLTFETVGTHSDDTAMILYTSGTTGRPKGAELSHLNLLLNARLSDTMYPRADHDVHLIALPLFHSFGQSVQMNAGVYNRATLVLLPRFTPDAAFRLMERENVTFFAGVPTMYWALLNHQGADNYDLENIARHLRLCVSGGAALPVEVMRAFEAKFKVKILEGYGLSETSPVATFNRLDRERKPGSIGLPVWGVSVRVVDQQDQDVGTNDLGEIIIRGHNVMKGYYKRPEATAEAMGNGWFHTGDIGRRDEEGYLSIADRLKDMIIRGGFNVYPREIEEVLMTHQVLNDLYADQMLHLGILHADPHPGNLLVQPGPRLVLLDHGLTVPLAPSLVDALRKMVQSLTSGDFDGVTRALAEAGLQLDGQVDITSLLQLVGVLLGNGQTSETDETAGDVDAVEVDMQIGKSIGSIPTDLLLVGRTLGLLDGITKQLDPNMDTMEIIAHYT